MNLPFAGIRSLPIPAGFEDVRKRCYCGKTSFAVVELPFSHGRCR